MHYLLRDRKLNIIAIGLIPIFASALSLTGCGGGGGGGDSSNIGSGGSNSGGAPHPYPSYTDGNQSAGDPVISLTWQLPSFNEDGSCADDVAGFRFYIGTAPGTYSYRGTASLENTNCAATGARTVCGAVMRCTYDLLGLPPSSPSWYTTIQAFDSSGNSSGFSNEIQVAAR